MQTLIDLLREVVSDYQEGRRRHLLFAASVLVIGFFFNSFYLSLIDHYFLGEFFSSHFIFEKMGRVFFYTALFFTIMLVFRRAYTVVRRKNMSLLAPSVCATLFTTIRYSTYAIGLYQHIKTVN